MTSEQKIKKNLIIGIVGQLATLMLGILLPKMIISSYGSEVNGLLSSVTNIYAYIAIVEAGVAAASCQALYKPIADDNRERINSILSATNKYYQRTGYIYLGLILAFSIIYPIFIRSEIPFFTVVLVILFNGLGNVINYFFHGKYLILLKADGKNYVRTGMELVTNTAKNLLKILFISLEYNVLFVQFAAMLVSFAQMGYITFYINKHYGWINLRATPDEKSISQSKNVFVHEINYLLTSNVDTVLLTVFNTLKTVSVYSLYNLLFSTVNRLLRVVRESVEFRIAHLYHKDKVKFNKLFDVFCVYYVTLAFAVFTVVHYFILPFISLYTKDVTDVEYVISKLPLLFVIVNFLSAGRYPFDAMVHIAGHFQQTQKSAVVETVINLAVSIVLAQSMGITGVLIGTVASSLYRTIYLIQYVNKNIVQKKTSNTYLCWSVNCLVFLLVVHINTHIRVDLSSYIKIFSFCMPYAFLVCALYFVIISLCFPKVLREGLKILKKKK